MKNFWLVTYDITDQRRLRLVSKYLEGFGFRLQKSVFKLQVNEKDIERIKWEINKKLADEDNILYFKFCKNCASNNQKHNISLLNDNDNKNYIIL